MPSLTRIGLALLGLSLAVTPATQAGAPFMKGSYLPPDPKPQKAKADPSPKGDDRQPEGTLCPDCQRAELAEKGIMVPPAPPTPKGIIVGARPCVRCNRPATMIMADRLPRSNPPMMTVAHEPNGRAVVGDVAPPPGRAVVNDAAQFAEPAPVGLMQANYGGSVAGRPAPADRAALTPIPPAPTPVLASGERPNILAHLFGISAMRRDWRDMWEGGSERKREAHAATAYGPMDQPTVTDVPASMVYGRR